MKKPRAKPKAKAIKEEPVKEEPVKEEPVKEEEVKVKTTKPKAKKKEVEQPKIIEKYVEKQIPKIIKISKDKIIREPPDYNNIPEEIIQREIKKRQVTAKETRMNMRMENTKRLSMNIA